MHDQSSPAPVAGNAATPDPAEAAVPPAKERRKEGKKADRSIDTMFRVTFQNHIQLSQLADNKANMLISINGLIISVLIALLTPKLAELSAALLPALALMLGAVVSMGLAISAARPRITAKAMTLDKVRDNQGNLLFFSQFARLSEKEFQEAMDVMMRDQTLVHGNMIREIHDMGRVLLVKYRYLQLAYLIFLLTIIVAVVLFVIATLLVGWPL